MKLLAFLLSILLFSSASVPKLHSQKIAEGVTVSLPSDFVPMSDNDIAQRYPSTKKPLAMYTSLDRVVDFGVNDSKAKFPGSDLNILKDFYLSTILSLYNKVDFIQKGLIQPIKKRNYIVFEFTSEIDQTHKYTYLQYALINNRVFIFNFTCPQEYMGKWQATAKAVMQTLKLNDAQVSKNVVQQVEPEKKGKNSKETFKDLNSRKKAK